MPEAVLYLMAVDQREATTEGEKKKGRWERALRGYN